MPTLDPDCALTLAGAENIVASHWAQTDGSDRIGIEAEAFAYRRPARGGPPRRLPLTVVQSRLAASHDLHATDASTTFVAPDGARVTLEPGGQVEVSTPPLPHVPDVVRSLNRTWASVAGNLGPDTSLLAAGVDPWNRATDVPMQLDEGRYRAMDGYLAARGPSGAEMMRNTCSVQINLDAHADRIRWQAANAIAPALTGAFSTCSTASVWCRRAQIWQRTDPTRTGFPAAYGDPVSELTRMALDADILLILTDGDPVAGRPGTTFRTWIETALDDVGHPTAGDFRYHLTTLFPEVRVRDGVLEIRSPDAVPGSVMPILLTLAAGAVLDPAAASQIIDRCGTDHMHRWLSAAGPGLAAPRFRQQTVAVLGMALDGAARRGIATDAQLDLSRRFIDEFVAAGRSPAPDRPDVGPAAAIPWVRHGAATTTA